MTRHANRLSLIKTSPQDTPVGQHESKQLQIAGYCFAAGFVGDRDVVDLAASRTAGAELLATLAKSVFRPEESTHYLSTAGQGSLDVVLCVSSHLSSALAPWLPVDCFAALGRCLKPSGLALVVVQSDEEVTAARSVFDFVEVHHQAMTTAVAIAPEAQSKQEAPLSQAWSLSWLNDTEAGVPMRRLSVPNNSRILVLSHKPLARDTQSQGVVVVDGKARVIHERTSSAQADLKRRTELLAERTEQALSLSSRLAEVEDELRQSKETRAELERRAQALREVNRDLLSIIVADRESVQTAQRLGVEMVLLKTALREAEQRCVEQQLRRQELEATPSVKLVLSAKRVWDRTPLVKQIAKGILGPLLR